MQLTAYFAVLCATASTLSSALPASQEAEHTIPPVAGKALIIRGTDDPLIPNAHISPVILYTAAIIIFENLLAFQLDNIEMDGGDFGDEEPAQPLPAEPQVSGGVGVRGVIERLQTRVDNRLSGGVGATTRLMMNGQDVIFRINMQPIDGLTWDHIVSQLDGGFPSLQFWVEDQVRRALEENAEARSVILAVPANGDGAQAVQLAVFHWVRRPLN